MQNRLLPLVLILSGCKDQTPTEVEIPEAIRGAYGRTPQDAELPTLGLEVDVDTLRYSEMQMKVVQGEATGKNGFRIDLAEVTWARSGREPKRCKGTLARLRERLLVSLFEVDRDVECESSLDGDWSHWAPRTTFPEPMHGTYGSPSLYSAFEAFTVTADTIDLGMDPPLEIEEAVGFAGVDDRIILRRAAYGELTCRGELTVEEDRLTGTLESLPREDGEKPSARCPRLAGHRWSVDATRLPKGSLTNGKVTVAVDGETVTITTNDEQGLACEQKILRTGRRQATEVGRDRIAVGAGDVLLLSPATPTSGIEGCQERLSNLAAAQCAEYLGAPCDPTLLDALHRDRPDPVGCPTHIVIGEPTTEGRKIALLPSTIPNAVCFEMSGNFQE